MIEIPSMNIKQKLINSKKRIIKSADQVAIFFISSHDGFESKLLRDLIKDTQSAHA